VKPRVASKITGCISEKREVLQTPRDLSDSHLALGMVADASANLP